MGVELTREQIARFRRDGLLILPGRFPRDQIETLRAAFSRLRARANALTETTELDGALFVTSATGPAGEARLHRIVWCGAAEPALAATGADPRFLGPAAQLLGESAVDQLVNQAHFKTPGDGVSFPLHQDAWNRRYGTELWRDESNDGGYIQVILTIDPMTETNGPLLYVPGSHLLGPLLGEDRRARVDRIARATPPRPVIAEPGCLVLFGPFLVHGSTVNRSHRARRILVNGYARPGVNRRVYHGAGRGLRRCAAPNEHLETSAVLPGGSAQLGT